MIARQKCKCRFSFAICSIGKGEEVRAIVHFEGRDAARKGGIIKAIT
jgi:polyphosphate kinase 2 (PPK2 family)